MANPGDEVDRDGAGWTALDHAAGRGDLELVERLLDGADQRDVSSAYEIALAAGHRNVAVVLRVAQERAGVVVDHSWRPYCRAYRLAELRGFPGWREMPTAGDRPEPDDVVFLHDDLTVTRSGLHGAQTLFEDASPAWSRFCGETLGFAVPDDLDLIPVREGDTDGTT